MLDLDLTLTTDYMRFSDLCFVHDYDEMTSVQDDYCEIHITSIGQPVGIIQIFNEVRVCQYFIIEDNGQPQLVTKEFFANQLFN